MSSKYDPLIAHLTTLRDSEVVLTFPEIEAIIDGPLPLSATVMVEYWSGRRFAHTRALHARGWYGRIDRPHPRVRFTRTSQP